MAPRIFALVVMSVSHFTANQVWAQAPSADVHGPFVGHAVMVGTSDEVHRLPVAPPPPAGPAVEVNPRWGRPIPLPFGKPRVPDALAHGQLPPSAAARTPTTTLSFTGLANGSGGPVPPDPIGDVGPNHYVQMVNTRFAVFDKSGGLLAGPTSISALFSGLGAGNQCVINDDGDPVVVYDRLADRWLLSQFAVPGGPAGFHVCIAISQTPDPAGSYFLYDFVAPVFPDYFKIGVWPDGYYMSTNEGSPGPVGVYALDRARMLQGLSASFVRFVVPNKNFVLPSDMKGVRPPPAGAPNYFYTFTDPSFWGGGGVDRLELFAFHSDFAVPANSTLTPLPTIDVTAFNYTVCGYFVLDCIPQPSPGEKVDAVSEWPMFRFAYRNLKDHEALVGNFTVDVSGSSHAGIRWFELRKSGAGAWTLFQEGTHAPDANHRFMGSIAMDANGNIALGYSVSSASVNPSLRYATRLAGAAPGTLEAEATLTSGSGVQTNGFNRWGDYSAMTVDPSDDCTFWYTGEYYVTTSSDGWSTRIGAFKIPTCRATTFDDVGTFHFAYLHVEALAAAGLTSGCSTAPPLYCPDSAVTRAQMAVFLVRGIHGAAFVPPPATGTIFTDVPASHPFGRWIEQLSHDGVTAGCATSPPRYCPDASVTRAQMAVFLLRAEHGAGYTPPPATGTVFADVPASDPFAPWIEQLAAEGITGGCGGGNYCPGQAVTRAQMAIFLVRAFGLPL
jgi:hypothetical protein